MARATRTTRRTQPPTTPAGTGPAASLLIAALLLVTLGLFAEARTFPFINYDDPEQVSENPNVLGGLTPDGVRWAFTSRATGNWMPLTRISHMLDVSLFGTASGSHHLMSVSIHAVNTALLFYLLFAVSGYRWRSFVVALIFAIHPLHVESVVWINQRKDVLSAFFVLLSILAYGRYALRPGARRYAVVIAAYACALMAKPMAVTLPLLLVLIDFWPLGRIAGGRANTQSPFAPLASLRAAVVEKLPLILAAAGVTGLTLLSQRSAGAMSGLDAIPLTARLSNALLSYGVYIKQTLWPTGLAIFYPLPPEPRIAAAIVVGVALLVCVAVFARMRSNRPYLMVGFMWFLVALAPVLGLIRVGLGAHGDRYMYLAQTGLVVAAVWGMADVIRARPRLRSIAAAASIAVCAIVAAQTSRQLGYWRTTSTLFTHTLEATRDNAIAHDVLGHELRAAGRTEEAADHFAKAIAIWPWDIVARNGLGNILAAQGRTAEAEAEFRAAIAANPNVPPSYGNLGLVLRAQSRFAEAVDAFRAAIRIRPQHGPLHMGLATALEGVGWKEDAVASAQEALRLAPEDDELRSAGRRLFLRLGRLDAAAALIDAEPGADSVDRASLHYRRGNALVAKKRFDDAIVAFRRAIALGSREALVYANLGAALASIGRFPEAVEAFNEALRLDPGLTEVQENLELAVELMDAGGGF